MNAHRLFRSLRVALPALLVTLTLLAGLAMAAEPRPEAPLTTAFTYQGRLTDTAGHPIDKTCGFQFSLWDALTGPSQVGPPVPKPGVVVTGGFFTVQLDFGSVFDGTALWLEIVVQCAGDAAPTTLSPRQELTATPYALYAVNADRLDGRNAFDFATDYHDHWGQTWYGPGTATGLTLQGGTTGLSGSGATNGVYGSSAGATGAGLFGLATHSTGANYGVYAQSISSAGTGVYGAGGAYGVEASASSPTGYGVHGYASDTGGVNYGVYGSSASSVGYGVYGIVGSTGANYGVYGQSASGSGYGVYGKNDATSGSAYGVYGYSASSAGYGIYGEGNVGARFVGRGFDIIQGWDASEQVFKVTQGGAVIADGGFQCGQSITCDPAYTYCNEVMLQPCLLDEAEADFAELMPAARGLEPGDLLIIGPDGKLARSTQPYQPSVVGVYSTRPSYVGNSRYWAQPGYAPLALTGVVPVKVTAENGPIRPGDLLTASSLPGHAMRASSLTLDGITFYPNGVLVGKALAAFDTGTGVILMLVTLQ